MFHFFIKMLQRNKFARNETYKCLGLHKKGAPNDSHPKIQILFVILPMKTNNQILLHR